MLWGHRWGRGSKAGHTEARPPKLLYEGSGDLAMKKEAGGLALGKRRAEAELLPLRSGLSYAGDQLAWCPCTSGMGAPNLSPLPLLYCSPSLAASEWRGGPVSLQRSLIKSEKPKVEKRDLQGSPHHAGGEVTGREHRSRGLDFLQVGKSTWAP